MDSTNFRQIRLWPENVEALKKQSSDTKLSVTYLANATIRDSIKAQQEKKDKAKQK